MLFRQFVDSDLGCASYLIGSEQAGEAIVVDPAFAIEQYVEEAERHSLRIVRGVETHNHADHVAGHGRLATEHGARVSIHPLAEPEYDFDPMVDGDVLQVGEVSVRVLHTPGHRPEHCALRSSTRSCCSPVTRSSSATQRGRTSRSAPRKAPRVSSTACGASRSCPTTSRVPGSRRGLALRRVDELDPSSTIGNERRSNMRASHRRRRRLRRGRTLEERAPAAEHGGDRRAQPGPVPGGASDPLPAGDVRGATVLDVRDAEEFAAGHLPGALNVPLSGGSFATKSAFVLGDGPSSMHARSETQARDAAAALRAVGLLELEGFVVDPPGSEERLEPVDIDELERSCAGRRGPAGRAGGRRARRGLHRGLATHPVPVAPRSQTASPTGPSSRFAAPAPERESPPASLRRAGSTRDPCSTAASRTGNTGAAARSSFAAAARKLRHDVIGERPGALFPVVQSSIRLLSLGQDPRWALSRECRWVRRDGPRRGVGNRRGGDRAHAEPAVRRRTRPERRDARRRSSARRTRTTRRAVRLVTAMPSGCRSRTGEFDALTFTYLLRTSTTPARPCARTARATAGRSPLNSGSSRSALAHALGAYVRLALPLAGRS